MSVNGLYWKYTCTTLDGFQPKMFHFSTCHLILVNYKVLSHLSQTISLSFLYLSSIRQNLVIELCRDNFVYIYFTVAEKKNLKFFTMVFFAVFNNALFHFYLSWELTILWLTKIISEVNIGYTLKNITNIHHNIYYLYIFEFQFCYSIVYFGILPFYITCFTIRHG